MNRNFRKEASPPPEKGRATFELAPSRAASGVPSAKAQNRQNATRAVVVR